MSHVSDEFISLWSCTYAFREALREDANCKVLEKIKEGELSALWHSNPGSERWLWKDVPLDKIPKSEKVELCDTLDGVNSTCILSSEEQKFHEVLPRLILPPARKILFSHEELKKTVLWTNFMLFDEKANTEKGEYVYRIVQNLGGDACAADILTILYRAPEISPSFFNDYCLDFSDMMRDQIAPNYALIASDAPVSIHRLSSIPIYNIVGKPNKNGGERLRDGGDDEIVKRAYNLRVKINKFLQTRKEPENDPEEKLGFVEKLACISAQEIEQDEKTKEGIIDLDEYIRDSSCGVVFFHDEAEFSESEKTVLVMDGFIKYLSDCMNLNTKENIHKELETNTWKLANYFIWLAATHPELENYLVRHVFDFRLENEARRRAVRPSGIVIATSNSNDENLTRLVARAEILMHELLSPLTSYYARENLEAETAAMYARGASHGFKSAMQAPLSVLSVFKDKSDLNALDEKLEGLSSLYKENLNMYQEQVIGDLNQWTKEKIQCGLIVKKEVDFLAEMANSMFWIMDPQRMRMEIKDNDDGYNIENILCALLGRSFIRALMAIGKNDAPVIGERFDIMLDVLSYIDGGTLDGIIGLINSILPGLNIQMTFDSIPRIHLNKVDPVIFKNISYELMINAFKAAIVSNAKKIDFRIAKSEDWIVLTIANSTNLRHSKILAQRWREPLVYKSSGSGGIKGVLQVRTLEKRGKESCGSTVSVSPPKISNENGNVTAEFSVKMKLVNQIDMLK